MPPYFEDPENWQTAYAPNRARPDAIKNSISFLLPITSLFLIMLGYAIYRPILFVKLFEVLDFYSIHLPRDPRIFLIFLATCLVFAITLAFGFASKFLTEFYQPPKGVSSIKVINYRLFGNTKLPFLNVFPQFEHLTVKNGEVSDNEKWLAWIAQNLGGPIMLTIFDGCALYLERENRFSRVVGPGDQVPFLEWYETIKYAVDLRPKVKIDSFNVWTKDGIVVKITVQIECRIGDPAKHDAASSLIYPFDPLSVKKAIERYSLRWPNRLDGDPSEFTWIDAVWGQVTGIIPSYIGGRMLDDLFIADRQGGQILSPDAMREIFEKLNNASKGFGVYITDFQILKIELPKEVDELRKNYWKAERQSIAIISEGQTKAYNTRVQGKAQADNQYDQILTIIDSFQKNESASYSYKEKLLISLSRVINEGLRGPQGKAYTAAEMLEAFEKLQKMLNKE